MATFDIPKELVVTLKYHFEKWKRIRARLHETQSELNLVWD